MSAKPPAKAKPRLGRGLSSLISISEVPVEIELPAAPTTSAAEAPPAASMTAAPVSPTAPSATAPVPPPAASEGKPTPKRQPPSAGSDVSQSRGLTSAPPADPIDRLPIDQVVANPHQPRQFFDEAKIAELAASIRASGLIQPIIVRQAGTQYQLIAGERRLRAARLAGLTQIPALVRDVDAVTQAQMALIENIQREDLNPIERALGYQALIEQLGLTQSELAGRLGEDRSSIANFLRLLDLSEPVKAMVRDGRLTLGHAKLIAGVKDPAEQDRLANLVLQHNLTVRNLEKAMKDGPSAPATRAPATPQSAHVQDLEKSITRQLGLKVQLRSSGKRGRLVIHYANLDQFDDLLGRLGIRAD